MIESLNHRGGQVEMTSFFAPRGEGWAMMTEDDKRGVKMDNFLMPSYMNGPLLLNYSEHKTTVSTEYSKKHKS